MSAMRGRQELPGWVMPTVIVVGVLLIVFITWKALTGYGTPSTGPDKEVKPGTYDFKKEAEKGNIGRWSGKVGDGTTP